MAIAVKSAMRRSILRFHEIKTRGVGAEWSIDLHSGLRAMDISELLALRRRARRCRALSKRSGVCGNGQSSWDGAVSNASSPGGGETGTA